MTSKHYKDKYVWIVGASSGIGKALAIELSKHNAHLIISSRNEAKLLEVKEICKNNGSKCAFIPLDLTDSQNLKNKADLAYSQYKKIDFLILNGGVSQRSYINETPLDIDRKIMEINYFGNIALTKAVLPYMIQQQSGHIATVSSIVGVFGFPLRSAYSASKHALHGFYESLRIEHLKDHITVSIIIPGRVKTNISINAIDKNGLPYNKLDKGQANAISPEKAAINILKGLRKEKKEILIGRTELIMVYLKRFFPYIFSKVANKIKQE